MPRNARLFLQFNLLRPLFDYSAESLTTAPTIQYRHHHRRHRHHHNAPQLAAACVSIPVGKPFIVDKKRRETPRFDACSTCFPCQLHGVKPRRDWWHVCRFCPSLAPCPSLFSFAFLSSPTYYTSSSYYSSVWHKSLLRSLAKPPRHTYISYIGAHGWLRTMANALHYAGTDWKS